MGVLRGFGGFWGFLEKRIFTEVCGCLEVVCRRLVEGFVGGLGGGGFVRVREEEARGKGLCLNVCLSACTT